MAFAIIFPASHIHAQEQARSPEKAVAADGSEIVVTGRRLPRQLDGARPIDDLSERRLTTYGARTINELIDRIRQQQGGRPFSIVVNGRRIQSLNDIGELPPEALESIQIFSPAEAGRYGYGATDRLLNLSLKKDFQTLAIDGDGDGSSDGGANSGAGALRGVRLAGERRMNGTASAKISTGLLSSQRPTVNSGSGNSPVDQSLIPRSSQFAAAIGASVPIGSEILDIGARGDRVSSVRQVSGTAIVQRNITESGGLNLSYSKTFNGFFLTLLTDFGYSRGINRVRVQRDCSALIVSACVTQDLATRTRQGSIEAVLSGKIAQLPAGDARLDAAFSRQRSRTRNDDRLTGQIARATFGSISSRLNLALPIISPSTSLDFLGRIDVTPSLDYNAANGIGGAVGKGIIVAWSPAPALQINTSLSRRTLLASNDDINSPSKTLVGITAYDYQTNAIVQIDQIVGGVRLPTQIAIDRSITVNYNKAIGGLQLAANLSFTGNETRRPPIGLTEPSALFERMFPDRFIRNAMGALVRVDARPFSAVSRSTRSLSGSLSLAGVWRAGAAPGGSSNGTAWTIGIQGEHQLSQTLVLSKGLPTIDTLKHPLSLSTGAFGPTRMNVQLGATTARLGGNLTLRWSSGLHSASFTNASTGVRVAALTRIDTSVFANLGKRGSTAGYRLQLSINNILNTRPRVETFNFNEASRLNPWLLDPIGRQILLSLRVPLIG